jgi:aspartyl-tRNA(Asn)/glutamyl-tRNA(Gln) amidotransferase subunit B
MELQTVIGLEIHVQLKTKTKMFCSCDNTGENLPANSCICPVCLGHPGVLPIANKQAIEWSALASMAINCQINEYSKFDRKHYYYPDLPKAYQISQLDQPISSNGYLYVLNPETNEEEKVLINRLHLEEDAAKLQHEPGKKYSLIDFNRGGTPLMEVVTEADIKNPGQAKLFLQQLRQIMRYLEISDADMEKGHLRCDANVSLRPNNDTKLYPKTEVKNLNSFKAVEKSLVYEISRQEKLWLEGNPPNEQTTRGWDDNKGVTTEQRSKEEANDYRYFPEPDIPPIHFDISKKCDPNSKMINIECLKADLPELPEAKIKRFMGEYDLPYDDVRILIEEKKRANFFEQVISELENWIAHEEKAGKKENVWEKYKPELTKLASNWTINQLLPLLEEKSMNVETMKMTAENMAELVNLIFTKKLNSNSATQILAEMIATGADPSHLIKDKNLDQISDAAELDSIIKKVIKKNPNPAADYKSGKEKALQSLVGKTMAATKGQANPEIVLKILKDQLK